MADNPVAIHNGRPRFTVARIPGYTEPEYYRAYGMTTQSFVVGKKPVKLIRDVMRTRPHSALEISQLRERQATCEDGQRFRIANKIGVGGERDELETIECLKTGLIFRAGGRCPGCPNRSPKTAPAAAAVEYNNAGKTGE